MFPFFFFGLLRIPSHIFIERALIKGPSKSENDADADQSWRLLRNCEPDTTALPAQKNLQFPSQHSWKALLFLSTDDVAGATDYVTGSFPLFFRRGTQNFLIC